MRTASLLLWVAATLLAALSPANASSDHPLTPQGTPPPPMPPIILPASIHTRSSSASASIATPRFKGAASASYPVQGAPHPQPPNSPPISLPPTADFSEPRFRGHHHESGHAAVSRKRHKKKFIGQMIGAAAGALFGPSLDKMGPWSAGAGAGVGVKGENDFTGSQIHNTPDPSWGF